MKRIFSTLLTFACAISMTATTYYASPDGAGNGLSYSSPASWAKGLAAINSPGDTLYLLRGTYEFADKQSVNKKGSAARPIVIAAFPGHQVTLDFHKVPYGTRGLTIHADALYIHVKNIAIAYSGKNNLYCEGSYCLFENLDIYGSADTGCQMKKGGNNTILNCDSHDNFDYQTMSGTTANFGGNADGFADKQFSGPGNHYIGCRAWNNSDDGWDFFQRVSTTNTVIENCICYRNGPAFYNMKDHPRYLTDRAWFDSKTGTQMTDRYGNTITVTLDHYPCQGNGNGFKMGGQYTDHKILIHHCLAVANNARGFDQNNNGGTMWVYNNSAYANTVNFGFTTAYGTNTIRNNISLGATNNDQPLSKTVIANDHNSWNNSFACSPADFLSLDTTEILAPRNPDGSYAEGTLMRLAAGSRLIDAGVDVNLGYNGNAPDLGCYESDGEHHDPQPDTDTVPLIQPQGTHAVAFVTIPDSPEDQPLLDYLRANDSLWIVPTDANEPQTDYSPYELIILGPKPNSAAAAYANLRGYNRPTLLLKPWILKPAVWNWATPVNTSDLAVSVSQPQHPLFRGLTLTGDSLTLFSYCNTNAVTAVSDWTDTSGFAPLASPVSQPDATSVAWLPAGSRCNGTVLPQPMIMIGLSEYSTAYLTHDAKQLILNAVYLLLGITNADANANTNTKANPYANTQKLLLNGHLYIRLGDRPYNTLGSPVN